MLVADGGARHWSETRWWLKQTNRQNRKKQNVQPPHFLGFWFVDLDYIELNINVWIITSRYIYISFCFLFFLIIFVFNSVSNETKTVMKWLTVHCVKKYIKL